MSTSFRPTGSTSVLSVTNTSSSVQVSNTTQASSYRFHNNSASNEVYIAFNPTSAPTAAIPTAGNPATGIPIHPNSTAVFTFNANGYIAAIASVAGPISLFITPGEAVP